MEQMMLSLCIQHNNKSFIIKKNEKVKKIKNGPSQGWALLVQPQAYWALAITTLLAVFMNKS